MVAEVEELAVTSFSSWETACMDISTDGKENPLFYCAAEIMHTTTTYTPSHPLAPQPTLSQQRFALLEIPRVIRPHVRNDVAEQLPGVRIDGADGSRVVLGLGVEVVLLAALQRRHFEQVLVLAAHVHWEVLGVGEGVRVGAFAVDEGRGFEVFVDVGEFDCAAVFAFVGLGGG